MATERCDKVAAGVDPGLSLSGKSSGRGPALFCNSSVLGLSFLQFMCARSLAFLQFIWHGNRHSRCLQAISARAMAPICVHRAPRTPLDIAPGHIGSRDGTVFCPSSTANPSRHRSKAHSLARWFAGKRHFDWRSCILQLSNNNICAVRFRRDL